MSVKDLRSEKNEKKREIIEETNVPA